MCAYQIYPNFLKNSLDKASKLGYDREQQSKSDEEGGLSP